MQKAIPTATQRAVKARLESTKRPIALGCESEALIKAAGRRNI